MIHASGFALSLGAIGLVLGILLWGGHTGPDDYVPKRLFAARISCPGPPKHSASPVSQAEADWYARNWRAAHEPSLYDASRDARTRDRRTWRFTWLRTFHAPVVVRIDETPDSGMRLTATQLSGRGGYDPGQIARRVARPLTATEQARFRAALAADRPFEHPERACRRGSDGSEWIFEAANDHGYRFASEWSPETGPLRDLGLTFLGFTGWRVDPLY